MTGLSQVTSESLQVQNYGIGGHYVPHWDIQTNGSTQIYESGNRIATVLFYVSLQRHRFASFRSYPRAFQMTDVERGGETVFPYLKLRIPPKKGTAAFWFNLRVSGQPDYITKHAACPVLLGNKWVANKWMHEHGQEFRRPCLPEQFKEASSDDYYKGFF